MSQQTNVSSLQYLPVEQNQQGDCMHGDSERQLSGTWVLFELEKALENARKLFASMKFGSPPKKLMHFLRALSKHFHSVSSRLQALCHQLLLFCLVYLLDICYISAPVMTLSSGHLKRWNWIWPMFLQWL